MVHLTRIYTKTGDKGFSSLGDGSRLEKDDPIFFALGAVDEANAAIGVASTFVKESEVLETLTNIQNQLFDLGADLSTPGNEELKINSGYIDYLEEEIDKFLAIQEPLTSFILPAGDSASAHMHLARTVVRRAELSLWTLMNYYPDTNVLLAIYINRLSDLLFVLARHLNREKGDVLWVPRKNR